MELLDCRYATAKLDLFARSIATFNKDLKLSWFA